MAAKKPTKSPAKKAAKKATRKRAAKSAGAGFTAEEREAMRETMRERKAAAAGGDERAAVVEKIAAMSAADRAIAERVHAIVEATAPALAPRLWYGMPAWSRDGKVLCFFQGAQKFKVRYSTLGFTDQAKLDDGAMWPTGFAVGELTPAVEARIAELLKKAMR